MKKLIAPLNLMILILLFTGQLFAQPAGPDKKTKYAFVKSKTITETYSVKKDDIISINNEFGKVQLHVWDKNEVKFMINAEVTCDQEKWAQVLFDRISFDYGKRNATVVFNTVITGNMSNGKWETEKESYTNTINIDYDIYLPAEQEVNIKNEFGNIILPDYKGRLTVSNSFGNIYAGALSQLASLNLEFGAAQIKKLSSGTASFAFTSDPVVIDKVSGSVKIDASNCGKSGVTIGLSEEVNNLVVHSEYSDIQAVANTKTNTSAKVSLSGGSLVNKTGFSVDKGPENDDGNTAYSFNPGGTDRDITISNNYGNILFTDVPVPMPKGEKIHGGISHGSSSGSMGARASNPNGQGNRSSSGGVNKSSGGEGKSSSNRSTNKSGGGDGYGNKASGQDGPGF